MPIPNSRKLAIEDAVPWVAFQTLEFAVVVLPFGAWGDRFRCIPVLHQLAIDNVEEIIKGGVDVIFVAFTHTKHKTPFCEQAMNSVVFYRDVVVGGGFG